jgi:hypothetical protein
MASAEEVATAMEKMAERLFQMGGTIGQDEHGFRAMGDQLAGWADDVRDIDRLLTRVRQLCESDGVNPTVQAIRRTIDG